MDVIVGIICSCVKIWGASFLLTDDHQLNDLPLHCTLWMVSYPQGTSSDWSNVSTLPFVPFIFSVAHFFTLTPNQCIINIFGNYFFLGESSSSLLSSLVYLDNHIPFYHPFNCFLQLDALLVLWQWILWKRKYLDLSVWVDYLIANRFLILTSLNSVLAHSFNIISRKVFKGVRVKPWAGYALTFLYG